MNRVAFVIGCARSGTTWLGRTIQGSPGLVVTIEHPPIFHLVDRMALDAGTTSSLMPYLVSLYQERIRSAAPKTYVDKSHQNIWLVESLVRNFPSSRFLAIERSPYAVVASMMRTPPVLAHFERWRSFPVPNRHIGLSPELTARYDELSLVEKCALRWRSHHRRLSELVTRFPERLLLIRFEDLVLANDAECRRISDFLEVRVPASKPDCESLTRWKAHLSERDCGLIDAIVEDVETESAGKGLRGAR